MVGQYNCTVIDLCLLLYLRHKPIYEVYLPHCFHDDNMRQPVFIPSAQPMHLVRQTARRRKLYGGGSRAAPLGPRPAVAAPLDEVEVAAAESLQSVVLSLPVKYHWRIFNPIFADFS